METVTITLLNPKAKKLLETLEELGIIRIESSAKNEFKEVLMANRSKIKNPPTLEEITKEVEIVRAKRYKSKK